jgi:hypothetical protein
MGQVPGDIGLIFLHEGDDLALAFLPILEEVENLQPGGLSNSLEITAFQFNQI